jgi:putative ABC transport system permease protein
MSEDITLATLHGGAPRAPRETGPPVPKRRRLRRRLAKPALLDVRFGALVSIYAWRLRHHGLQELLAGIGIAIGVALMFGVLVSSQSITGSASNIVHDIVGSARLQVTARSPEGFDERLVERIGELPGVRVAAPVLRADGVIAGPGGRHSVHIVGTTASQLDLEGRATRYLGSEHLGESLALTATTASDIGASAGGYVTLLARGRAERLPVHAVWTSQQVRSIADGPLAVATLSVLQRELALPHRVTQVLIVPAPGSDRRVRAELERLLGGRLDVQSAHHEVAVLDATAKPTTESSRLFAAIGAIVGFLFAVNAMLLTVPERRRWVAEARTQGYGASQIVVILGFQALVLGVVASLIGVLIGYLLASALFTALPDYLTLSFPIGNHPLVSAWTIALAACAGVLATLLASAAPLRDLSPRKPIDAVLHDGGKVGHSIGASTMLFSGAVGAAIVVGAILLALLAPSLSIVAVALLALGGLCAVPALLVSAVRILMPVAERMRRSMLAIALAEVEGTATRSIALASVATLAVYGSVAVVGAREDLIGGLDAATVQLLDTADVWVTPVGNNPFLTDSFSAQPATRAILGVPGVAAVRTYQSSFLDLGARRVWVRARPAGDRDLIQASQLRQGNLARATALLRAGGWAAVSSGFAAERGLTLGSHFSLPTPKGALPLRVAATTANSGWPPGAITVNQRDYERAFRSGDPTALEVNLQPGVRSDAARRAIAAALAGSPDLRVQTVSERIAQHKRDEHQGVQSLTDISRFVLIAAALAIMFALSSAIAARRVDLASRKAEGYEPAQLWRILLLESAVVVGTGALAGAGLGVAGHALASRWLRLTRGFPAPFSVHAPQLVLTLGIVAAVALGVVAVVGYLAVRVPPRLGARE